MNVKHADQSHADKLAWLRSEIQKGLDDIEAGRVEDGRVAMTRIHKRLLDRITQKGAQDEHQRHST